ncbi:serine/threonine-protein kinase [Streptacidiphilus sp. N1-3]|uniref:non-specific serine/threonine protein kinase n=1 Tax=Streptacidiphilus alkalitolerans TaxID=3342712 RepID=A0ABV6WX32_9ACTN
MEEIEDLGDVERRYEVMRQMGEGGQGDLFLARDRRSGMRVALKAQKVRGFESEGYFADLAAELAAEGAHNRQVALVNAIPRVLAMGHYERRRCIVFEFIDGTLLYKLMASHRPIKDVATIASIIGQLCEITSAVHELNITHRDLKPDNVMVEADGRIRLIDLGFATTMNEATKWGCGTIGYAPPEQLGPQPAGVDQRADVFALGCMLLEMTVMHLPYGGHRDGLADEAFPVLPPAPLAEIPAPFERLALDMVQRDRERRPADMHAVLARLRPILPSPGSRRPTKPLTPDPTEYYRSRPAAR